jgi:hypothetical protein
MTYPGNPANPFNPGQIRGFNPWFLSSRGSEGFIGRDLH